MNDTLTLHGQIITASMTIDDGVIAIRGERIQYAGPASQFPGTGTSRRHRSRRPPQILLPGLVDLHCHGALGGDFSEGSSDTARKAARFLHTRGTTTLLASLVTASPSDLLRNLNALRPLTEERLIAGTHLEGPFLSPHHHGAHDPSLLREPDLVLLYKLMEKAGPTLKSMTLAPELPGAVGLVDQLTSQGIIPSLGHTAVDSTAAEDFLEYAALSLDKAPHHLAGRGPSRRPTVTHLFNAMPPMHHRSPGPVAASLRKAKAGKVVIELIADGVHLAPDTVHTVFDLVGAENIALVTDSMAATGLHDGNYRLGGLAVTVKGGVASLDTTGAIAGGTATLLDVVRHAVNAGVTVQDAIRSATAVPASVLGLSAELGDLREGMLANVLVVDPDLNLTSVLRHGAWVK